MDEIIPEPRAARTTTRRPLLPLEETPLKHLKALKRMPLKKRLDARYEKFRDHGQFEEEPLAKAAR
ncbi:MAG: hypothetical protein CM1200mP29_13930 [Verrucomicrobiota bacterium]|nr:MAG: hypothetical protein CM1200mP29_13930 [Verrucomicrobiota bacterium]